LRSPLVALRRTARRSFSTAAKMTLFRPWYQLWYLEWHSAWRITRLTRTRKAS